MGPFLLRRILTLIPVFFGITLITFFVTELAPGDPVDLQMQLNPKISLEAKAKLLERYGLDRPIWERYARWTKGLLLLDFGRSFKDGEKVVVKIAKRIPVTLLISVLSLVLILSIAIPLGRRLTVHSWRWWISCCVFRRFFLFFLSLP